MQTADKKGETRPPLPRSPRRVRGRRSRWPKAPGPPATPRRSPSPTPRTPGGYTEDSRWRNRDEFFEGREAIVRFVRRKWARELDYRLIKDLWCVTGNRISVRLVYESHDASRQWWRSRPYHRFATKLSIVAATGREPEVALAVA